MRSAKHTAPRQRVMDTTSESLTNLELPQYSSIKALFGRVLLKRARFEQPDCTLFRWLAREIHELQFLNEDCAVYIGEIGLEDALRKCHREVLGNVRLPFLQFNGSVADFWAEIAAIRVLRSKGYTRFRAIHGQQPDGSTSDYEAYRGDQPLYIEVKNMRPNKTVQHVFEREIQRLHENDPHHYAFQVVVDYPFDNLPTGDQERKIREFLKSIRGRKPEFHESLDLGEAVARITVREGGGTASMTRGISFESPEPLRKEWFLGKIRNKAEEAYVQMNNVSRPKVLVVNFDSQHCD